MLLCSTVKCYGSIKLVLIFFSYIITASATYERLGNTGLDLETEHPPHPPTSFLPKLRIKTRWVAFHFLQNVISCPPSPPSQLPFLLSLKINLLRQLT